MTTERQRRLNSKPTRTRPSYSDTTHLKPESLDNSIVSDLRTSDESPSSTALTQQCPVSRGLPPSASVLLKHARTSVSSTDYHLRPDVFPVSTPSCRSVACKPMLALFGDFSASSPMHSSPLPYPCASADTHLVLFSGLAHILSASTFVLPRLSYCDPNETLCHLFLEWTTLHVQSPKFNAQPFRVDLAHRLAHLNVLLQDTKLPDDTFYPAAGIQFGVELDFVRGLQREWLVGFDWARQGSALNEWDYLI